MVKHFASEREAEHELMALRDAAQPGDSGYMLGYDDGTWLIIRVDKYRMYAMTEKDIEEAKKDR